MTVILLHDTKRYVGLSTDTKPTLAREDAGSEFLETDTYQGFYWTGMAWNRGLEIETHASRHFAQTTPGDHLCYTIYMDIAGIILTTGFMVIDLSDIVNWPHNNTGHIGLEYIITHINPDDAFVGTTQIGFLANVDDNNGDFHILTAWDMRRKSDTLHAVIEFGEGGRFECQAAAHFGGITLNDATWQSDVNLIGPPGGAAAYPAGNGDLVMKIIRTAGTVNIDLTVGYRAKP